MKKLFILLIFLSIFFADDPVFKNPGIPAEEYYEIKDYINQNVGFVTGKVQLDLKEQNGQKYYELVVWENSYYLNKLKINYNDLTTISEQRIDQKANKTIEEFGRSRNGNIYFINSEKQINKIYHDLDQNYYSRYGYMMSFRGFPFEKVNEVYFKTYMNEFAAAPLTMRLRYIGKENIQSKIGLIKCYKLELTVAGWQGAFSNDIYYFYYSQEKPHYFVRFLQKVESGSWLANEVLKYSPSKK